MKNKAFLQVLSVVSLAFIASFGLVSQAVAQGNTNDYSFGRLYTPVVNVFCSDGSQDARNINYAISNSVVGSKINIHGTCLINQTIILKGDRTYVGDSRTGTILREAAGANLAAIVASDSWVSDSSTTGDPVRIAHLTIEGTGSNGGGSDTSGLVIRSWLTVIEDLQIENVSGDGIQITGTSENGIPLANTQVNGRISNIFITNVGGDGIHVIDSGNSVTDWDLLNSWIGGVGLSGIDMDNAAGWKIIGIHLYGIRDNAIYANRCFATTIADNYIEGFGDAGNATTYYGIACTLQGNVASVISGNKIFQLNKESGSGKYIYIGIPQVNYGIGVVNIIGNAIYGAMGSQDIGLSYQVGSGTALRVLSANNVQNVTIPRLIGSGVTLVSAL